MSAAAEPRPTNRARPGLVPGLLLVAVLLAAVTGLALRGSSRLAEQPYSQLSTEAATGELAAGGRLGQTFRVEQSGLYRIDVHLSSGQRQTEGALVLHVSAAPFVGPDLARATADASALPADGFMAFEFAPLSEPVGQPLAFWLEAPDAPPGKGLAVLGAAHEAYPGGAAVFDQQPATHGVQDLSFKVYYRSGLLGSLAELFARQAAGRPGIFGWPPLYVGLLLAYLAGLAAVLAAAVRWLRL